MAIHYFPSYLQKIKRPQHLEIPGVIALLSNTNSSIVSDTFVCQSVNKLFSHRKLPESPLLMFLFLLVAIATPILATSFTIHTRVRGRLCHEQWQRRWRQTLSGSATKGSCEEDKGERSEASFFFHFNLVEFQFSREMKNMCMYNKHSHRITAGKLV